MRALKPRKGKLMTGEEALAEALAYAPDPVENLSLLEKFMILPADKDGQWGKLYVGKQRATIGDVFPFLDNHPNLQARLRDHYVSTTGGNNIDLRKDNMLTHTTWREAITLAQQSHAQLLTPRQYIILRCRMLAHLTHDANGNRIKLQDAGKHGWKEFIIDDEGGEWLGATFGITAQGMTIAYHTADGLQAKKMDELYLKDPKDIEEGDLAAGNSFGLPRPNAASGKVSYIPPGISTVAAVYRKGRDRGELIWDMGFDPNKHPSDFGFRLAFTEEKFEKYLKKRT